MGTTRRRGILALGAVLVLTGACGGDGDEVNAPTAPARSASPSTTARPANPAPTRTTVAPPEGVATFPVDDTSHTNEPVAYPQTPPVGGAHHPTWEPCVFRDRPVVTERAVHSLEHGAIWATYRPDLPAEQVATLRRLAESRTDVLVSRWDDGLPAPVVVSSWGRQLELDSANDPRLLQFVRAFSGQAPEPGAPC